MMCRSPDVRHVPFQDELLRWSIL